MTRATPRRGRLLLAAALVGAAGVGVVAAVARGLGEDARPPASVTPTVASPTATPGMRVAREIEVGERPNVVRVAGDTVFVGSFKSPRVALVSTKTGRVKDYTPHVGVGVSDAAVGLGAVWFVLSRPNRIVRLDPQTGHPIGAPITTPASPGSIALSDDAVWVSQRHGPGIADDLLKLDPETGQTLALTPVPDGISSLTTSPSAVWIANRRRARVQRVDLDTAAIVDTLTVGSSHSEDAVYGDGGLWLATPRDGTVYKLPHGELPPIPISVGKAPRQLALGKGVVYVTNYNSSDLYAIDAKRSRVRADPLSLSVNPFSLDVADGTVWVGSLPENRLSRVVTGRDG
jgi:streptogramin lyase